MDVASHILVEVFGVLDKRTDFILRVEEEADQAANRVLSLTLITTCCLLGSIFRPEDGGGRHTFTRNASKLPLHYTASHPERWYPPYLKSHEKHRTISFAYMFIIM
jgi:hypothetical protein